MHVRRKLKENRGKMKKLEGLIIKGHQSINLGPFVNFVLEVVSERKENQEEKRIKQAKEGEGKKRKDKKSKESKD